MTIFGVGFMLFSQIATPVAFFATFFMMAVGSSLGGYLPVTVAIVNWFRRRRALALSISATGMAMGGFFVQIVVAALSHVGWRWTAFASGVLILAVGLPLAQLIRHRPEIDGQHPDGDPPHRESSTVAPEQPRRRLPSGHPAHVAAAPSTAPRAVDFTARQAIRTRAFWFMSIGHGAALLVVSAVMVHLIIHVTEQLGYSLRQGAAVLALMTALQVAGQLTGGWAGDRGNKRLIAAGCMLAHAVALALLAWATAFWMVVVFAVLHGVAWGMRGPLMGALRADYFGSAAFGTISGFSSTIVMFGMMGGPLIAGVLADRTGSYRLGFTVLAALAALGSVFFALATRPVLETPGPERARNRAGARRDPGAAERSSTAGG
jgi:MFS family permease